MTDSDSSVMSASHSFSMQSPGPDSNIPTTSTWENTPTNSISMDGAQPMSQ